MIEIKHLSKTFQMKDGAVNALKDINLTIPDAVSYTHLDVYKRQVLAAGIVGFILGVNVGVLFAGLMRAARGEHELSLIHI